MLHQVTLSLKLGALQEAVIVHWHIDVIRWEIRASNGQLALKNLRALWCFYSIYMQQENRYLSRACRPQCLSALR
jgi:hypothetical protein